MSNPEYSNNAYNNFGVDDYDGSEWSSLEADDGWREYMAQQSSQPEDPTKPADETNPNDTEISSESEPIDLEGSYIDRKGNIVLGKGIKSTNPFRSEQESQSNKPKNTMKRTLESKPSKDEQAVNTPFEEAISDKPVATQPVAKPESKTSLSFFDKARLRAEEALEQAKLRRKASLEAYNKSKKEYDEALYNYDNESRYKEEERDDAAKRLLAKFSNTKPSVKEHYTEAEKDAAASNLKALFAKNNLSEEKHTEEEKSVAIENILKYYSEKKAENEAKKKESSLREELKEKKEDLITAQKTDKEAKRAESYSRNVVDAFIEEQEAQKAKTERKAKQKAFEDQFGYKSPKEFLRQNEKDQARNEAAKDDLLEEYYRQKDELSVEAPKKEGKIAEELNYRVKKTKAESEKSILEKAAHEMMNDLEEKGNQLQEKGEAAKAYESYYKKLSIRNLLSNQSVKAALRKIIIFSYILSNQGVDNSVSQNTNVTTTDRSNGEVKQEAKLVINRNQNHNPAERPESEQAAA